jgi:hypothetical protein
MKEKYREDEEQEAKNQAELLNRLQAEAQQQTLFSEQPTDSHAQSTPVAKPECK